MLNAYLRPDGRKGIRNTIVVAYLVECAHHVSREVVFPYREQGVHLIGFPGCFPNVYSHRMMERLCAHPGQRRWLEPPALDPRAVIRPWPTSRRRPRLSPISSSRDRHF